jgi:hypothetical protein
MQKVNEDEFEKSPQYSKGISLFLSRAQEEFLKTRVENLATLSL